MKMTVIHQKFKSMGFNWEFESETEVLKIQAKLIYSYLLINELIFRAIYL